MRIPTISQIQGPVARAPTSNAGAQMAQLNSARLASDTQIAGSAVQITGQANQAFQTFKKLKAENQQEIAAAEVAGEIRSMEADMAGRDFYSPDEIPEGLDIRTTESVVNANGEVVEQPRERIPSHEVNPALFRSRFDALIEANAANIGDADASTLWARRMREQLEESAHKMEIQSLNTQRKEMKNINLENLSEALDNRNYDVAMGLADSDTFTDHESAGLRSEVRTRREMDQYDASISEGNLDSIVGSLQALRDPDYNDDLNEAQRLTYINKLGAAAANIQEQQKVDYTLTFQRLKQQIDRQTNSILMGEDVDAEFLSDLIEQSQAATNLEPNQMDSHNRKLLETVNFLPEMHQFMRMSDSGREQVLRGMSEGDMTPNQSFKHKQFSTLNDNINRRIDNDVVSFGDSIGVTEARPMPNIEEPEEFMEWLSHRQRGYEALQQRFGVGGYLTQAEHDLVSNTFETMGNEERLYTMSLVAESLGPDAPKFWQDLNEDAGGVFYVAGSIYNEQPNVARMILAGRDFAASDSYTAPSNVDVAMSQSRLIGQAYGMDSERDARLNSVNAVYAHLSKQEGDFDASVFNRRRYEQAVDMVTGGLLDVGGHKVAPPIRGMEQREFDRYIRDVSTSWFDSQGGVQGYQGQYDELRTDLRRGNVRMMGVGDNEYLLRSEVNGVDTFLLQENSSEPFIFRYDADAERIDRTHTPEGRRRGQQRSAGGRPTSTPEPAPSGELTGDELSFEPSIDQLAPSIQEDAKRMIDQGMKMEEVLKALGVG